MSNNQFITKYNQFAMGGSKNLHYKDFKSIMSNNNSKSIIQSPVINMRLKKEDMIKDILNLLNFNFHKFGNSYLHQVNGIPQGSVISNLLCNLYYGKLESKFMSKFIDESESCIMRATDDILFISSELDKAKEFYSLLSNWNGNEFALKVNLSKTKHNLNQDSSSNYVNWCGLHICLPYVDISTDISRMLSNPIRDTITSNLNSKPGESNLKNLINGVRFSIFRVFIVNSSQTSTFLTSTLFNLKRSLYICLLSQFNRFLVTLELFPLAVELSYLLKSISKIVQLLHIIFKSKLSLKLKNENLNLIQAEARRKQFIKNIQK